MSELLKTKEKLEEIINDKLIEFNSLCKKVLELSEELIPVEYLVEKCAPETHTLMLQITKTLTVESKGSKK